MEHTFREQEDRRGHALSAGDRHHVVGELRVLVGEALDAVLYYDYLILMIIT